MTKLADVKSPTGLLEGDGGFYAASRAGHQIVFVSSNGESRVLAGDGQAGYKGDGEDGQVGRLDSPQGLVKSADGTLFWAELNNHVIRARRPDGTLVTVAGTGLVADEGAAPAGEATKTALTSPSDVVWASDGTIYFLQESDHRIYQIKEGRISIVAGSGTKGFSDGKALNSHFQEPSQLVIGPDDLLYVVDTGNHRIRRLNADGTVSTVLGTGKSSGHLDGRPPEMTDIGRPVSLAFDTRGGMWVYSETARRLIYFPNN